MIYILSNTLGFLSGIVDMLFSWLMLKNLLSPSKLSFPLITYPINKKRNKKQCVNYVVLVIHFIDIYRVSLFESYLNELL